MVRWLLVLGVALPAINPGAARLEQTIAGLDGPGFAIAYNPDSDSIAVGCERGTIQTWNKDVLLNIRAGSGTSNRLAAHQGPVLALAWRGHIMASAGADQHILFWSMNEGQVARPVKVDSLVRALAIAPDGKTLAGGGEDGIVQLWETATAQPRAQLVGHPDWVLCLAFSADGKQLVSGGIDGSARLWDVAVRKKIADLPAPPNPLPKTAPEKAAIRAVAFSPDGKTAYLGGADGKILVVNTGDGKVQRELIGHTSAITGLEVHPSGAILASSSKDRTIRLWNPANPQALKVLEGHTAWVEGLAFIRQGSALASVGADQTVRIWRLND